MTASATLNSSPNPGPSLISFIIPHKGRFDMLKQTLSSIAGQDYPKANIEVIVVSQTPEIKNETLLATDELSVRVLISKETETISTLRNRGVTFAQGDYLAFLDADVFISRDWITVMLEQLNADKERVITSAMQICDDHAPALEKIRTALSNAELDCNVGFLPGRNLFMKRSTFEQVGGFPEHLVTCEDYYFTDKAAQLGHLYYTSLATYIHLGEDKELGAMFKKEIWRGQSNLQSVQGRRIPLREMPSFILPPFICFALLVALSCLLLAAPALAAIFTLLGLAPLLAYSSRLYWVAPESVKLMDIFKFYTVYFPARAIGTLTGVFKAIETDHKK